MIPENIRHNPELVYKFIGGRRRYNLIRSLGALERRFRLLFTWAKHPMMNKAALARELGVSRATITRDIQALKADEALRCMACPLCKGAGHIKNKTTADIEFVSDSVRRFPHLFL
jgi:predicted transcriptional regulator